MVQPIPGTPILQVLQGGLGKASNFRIGEGLGRNLPQGPINSTLQSLSPAEMAQLGLVTAVTGGTIGAAYWNASRMPGEGVDLLAPGMPNGTYGLPGVEYAVDLSDPVSEGSALLRTFTQLFGPITPTVFAFAGNRRAWQFDAFESNGNPSQVGGSTTPSNESWFLPADPKVFKVYLAGDPAKLPVEENLSPPTIEPFIFPSTPEIPPTPYEDDANKSRERIAEEIEEVIENVDMLAALVGAVAADLANKLTCNICELVETNAVWDEIEKQQLQNNVEELVRRTVFSIDTTVETSSCSEEENPVAVTGDTLAELALVMIANKTNLEINKENCCEIPGNACASPESWELKIAPNTPQTILRMRESAAGHTGTPRMRDFHLPDYQGPIDAIFPSWTRGDYRTTIRGEKGTKITIYAETAAESLAIATDLADRCNFFTERNIVTGFEDGKVVNKVALTPFKTLSYPNGQASGLQPSQIYNFELGTLWP